MILFPRRRAFLAATLFVGLAWASGVPPFASSAWAQTVPSANTALSKTQTKRPIDYAAYDTWRSIRGTALAPSGAWAAYSLTPQDGDGEMIVRALSAAGMKWRVARGTGGSFSPDENFVVCTVVPTKAERDKAKKSRRGAGAASAGAAANAPKNDMAVVSLATGKTQTVENVKRWDVPSDGGRFFAYLMDEKPKAAPAKSAEAKEVEAKETKAEESPDTEDGGQQGRRARQTPAGAARTVQATGAASAPKRTLGTDLMVQEFGTGKTVVLSDVTDFGWDKKGTRLWIITSAKDADKTGVFVWDAPKNGSAGGDLSAAVRPLKTGISEYKSPVWDEAGTQLAFLFAPKPDDSTKTASPAAGSAGSTEAAPIVTAAPKTPAPATGEKKPATSPPYQLYFWQADSDKTAQSIVDAQTTGMPKGMDVSENGSVFFSKSGSRLYFNYAPEAKPKPKAPELVVDVDVWSSRDPLLQPMQKIRAANERKRSYRAVWHIKNKKMVVLAAPDLPDVLVDRDTDTPLVLGTSDLLYQPLISWDGNFRDVYAVNAQTGERKKLLEKQGGSAQLSPEGKFLLYFNEPEGAWYVLDTNAKKPAVSLTGKLIEKFADEEDDHPSFPPPYGSAGWTKNDKTVLLYDKYDTWEFSPTGDKPPRKLTGGRVTQTVFRLQELDLDAVAVSTTDPLYFTATDDTTKATGLFRRTPLGNSAGDAGAMQKLVMQNKQIGGIVKAKKSNTVLMTWQTFSEYPNLWAANLDNAAQMTQLSDANPQQADYVWGKSELINYKSDDGIPLQGILTRPDNFDASKKYPLIVNIYERQTDRLNSYSTPAPGTSINITRYVSNGYFVLRPDIAYTPGYPGASAQKCVLPAISAVVAQGNIDSSRIGIQGHSWGAYQIAYLITRTNLFRAVEAGAAVSDMISAYGGIRWGTGQSRAGQYEKGQSRIGATPWTRPLQFIENSPIFWVDKVQTPYLTIHNDADGAVPWYQGIEFFTALRRLGKESYLFDYNGEDHNLVNRDNQKHWTIHMDEFFDHYLLSKPRPDWMDNGVPYLDRGTRDVAAFYSPPATAGEASQTSAAAPSAKLPLAPGGEAKPVTGTEAAPAPPKK